MTCEEGKGCMQAPDWMNSCLPEKYQRARLKTSMLAPASCTEDGSKERTGKGIVVPAYVGSSAEANTLPNLKEQVVNTGIYELQMP
eukprot:1161668-Pelagomonas_calceolata.AAC.17